MVEFLNLQAISPPALVSRRTGRPIDSEELERILPPRIAALELSRKPYIRIPPRLVELYSRFRPTPLFRARELERALRAGGAIYIKNEGATPSGSHKSNSAYLLAQLCLEDGFSAIATETTGNWGIALAQATRDLGLASVIFIDAVSARSRPGHVARMSALGADVVTVDCRREDGNDYLTGSATAAIEYAKERTDTTYLFGSVYNYFTLAQSIIGLEARAQLAERNRYPEAVVGSCGGGANLLGVTAPFLRDRLLHGKRTRMIIAEAETARVVSGGQVGDHPVDEAGYFPLMRTLGVAAGGKGPYIGGLGSKVVAAPVARFYREGIFEALPIPASEAASAASLLVETEGHAVARESGYALAAALRLAREGEAKSVLVNVSAAGVQ